MQTFMFKITGFYWIKWKNEKYTDSSDSDSNLLSLLTKWPQEQESNKKHLYIYE